MASSYGSTESTTHSECRRELTADSSSNQHHEGTRLIENAEAETDHATCCSCCSCTCMGDVTCQWIARILLLVLVTVFLWASRVSFAILVAQFGSELNDTNRTNVSGYGGDEVRSKSDGVFWLLLIVVCIPYTLNLLRCAYRGLAMLRGIAYPWPTCREIAVGIFCSIVEGLFVAALVIVIAPKLTTAVEIAVLPSVVIPVPIAVSLGRAIWFQRSKRTNSGPNLTNPDIQREREQGDQQCFSTAIRVVFESRPGKIVLLVLFALLGGTAAVLLVVDYRRQEWWAVLAAALPFSLIWSPSLQKLAARPENFETKKRSTRWVAGIINGVIKLVSVIGFAFLMLFIVQKRQRFVLPDISTELQYVVPFLVLLGSSLCAYLLLWLAFRTKMHFAGVYMPLVFASLASIILLHYPSFPCSTLNATMAARYCDKLQNKFVWIALTFLAIAELCAVVTIAACRLTTHPLVREEDLFIHPCYNGPFLGQTVMLNLKTKLDFSDKNRLMKDEITVIIASTMYHETRDEQKTLFSSIQKLYENKKKLPTNKDVNVGSYKFEWHILFDDAIEKKTSRCNEFVKTLLDVLKKNEAKLLPRDELPYGSQIKVLLKGDDDRNPSFPVVIHLKNTRKWKQKKRWSQVMYLQYVLNFRAGIKCEENHTKCPKKLKHEETYVLTTDGDVEFNLEDVDILLDRLNMDAKVGSVSGRVYPVGDGPVVWYQQFEYAAGYWLQKVAEHVLGTVMCSPGCFSAFRAEALAAVLPDYSKNVKEASDFLKMDMGEDRWLSTLLIRKDWRLDYAASSKCKTKCPESFDVLYKQRRRWIPSTLANIFYLGSVSWSTWKKNEAFKIFFVFYVIVFILSTVIGPSTILLVMAVGLEYSLVSVAENRYVIMIVSLYVFALVIFFYVWVCFYCCEKTQLFVAKVLTFFFAFVMAGVLIGVVLQVASGLQFKSVSPTARPLIIIPPGGSPNVSSVHESISLLENSSSIRDKLSSVAFSTWYLGGMISIFFIAALLHISDFFVLLKGLLYLFCLPSGFILMMAFALCNLTNQSWGTREKSTKSDDDGKTLYSRFLEGLAILRKYCCCCFSKDAGVQTLRDDGVQSFRDVGVQAQGFRHAGVQTTETAEMQNCNRDGDGNQNGRNDDEDTFWRELPDETQSFRDAGVRTAAEIQNCNRGGEGNQNGRNDDENGLCEKKFWQELPEKIDIEAEATGRVPRSDEIKLKENLEKLRSYWLWIFITANTLWTVLNAVLQLHPVLMVRNSNVLGLMFLIVYGITFVVQFFACIWNRFETLIHYLSRRNPQENRWNCCCRYQENLTAAAAKTDR